MGRNLKIWRNLQGKLAFKIDIFKRSSKFWFKNAEIYDRNLGKFSLEFYNRFWCNFAFKYKNAKFNVRDEISLKFSKNIRNLVV